ncbi:Sodium/calcium exchanger 2 [Nymphon striatum]|nr:Sodium/calcium exchanger 2 [Nymphon striatum]KAG1685550.1 Sodium/calcium exchanger 2 [Nymphon striatum]
MSENYTLYNYKCSDKGLLLPIVNEFTWAIWARAFVYFAGLLYCFLGVAIIADIFMCSIEKITSKTKKIILSSTKAEEPEVIEVKIWNDTVANLTLMALGSSAPEILLSVIEICGKGFESGELGPGTIVGSAAFNLLVITAVCITLFAVTAFFSIFAYLWMLIILEGTSKDIIEIWEAVLTFAMFPILVILAYIMDKDICPGFKKKKEKGETLELALSSADKPFTGGKMDKEGLINFIKDIKKYPGLSEEDAACLAANRLVDEQHHSRMWYRVGAIRSISGGRKAKPQMSDKLKEQCQEAIRNLFIASEEDKRAKVYNAIENEDNHVVSNSVPIKDRKDVTIIEFNAASCAVMEDIGKVSIKVRRHGMLTNQVRCSWSFCQMKPKKTVHVEIVNDNQWEPDETFFMKIMIDPKDVNEVILGRISIMEITILNDDEPGILQFKKRGFLVKESCGTAVIPVIRKNGADGVISATWKTIDQTAVNTKDFTGGEGIITFQHAEIEKNIEIPIHDDFNPEKDEHFEIELTEPKGGAVIGQISRTTVTIANDDDFNSILGRLMVMTNANIDSLRIESDTWMGQLRDAMNVNGGDIENASRQDYILHFLTFGWKIIFAFLPPVSILGGWLTFFTSLGMIGMLTAIVGDLATIFGCLVGLKDSVTAITFVALGTSLPDLFASKLAAAQEKYADNAIGNVTGSNSVNVFLGLGLPWLIASIYWKAKDKPFNVPAGSLSFSVSCYAVTAFLCIVLLMLRRFCSCFGRGELGGPKKLQYASAIFLLFLWVMYILLTSLQAYDHIKLG